VVSEGPLISQKVLVMFQHAFLDINQYLITKVRLHQSQLTSTIS